MRQVPRPIAGACIDALLIAKVYALRVFLVGRAHVKQEAFGIDDYIEVVQAYTRYVAACTPTQPTAA